VLDQMARNGYITKEEARAAGAEDLRPQLKFKEKEATGPAPHFAQYVLQELERQLGASVVNNGDGLTVYTTLDLDIQKVAVDTVSAAVPRFSRYGVNNAALLAMDERPGHEGQILAMVGSADFNKPEIAGQVNIVTALRQPGSSFKPYDYVTGIGNRHFNTLTAFHDTPEQARKMSPQNPVSDFDNSFQGVMTLRTALTESRNVPAEEAMQKAGTDAVIQTAHDFGISTPLQNNLATAIGGSEVRMIDHAVAYSVFATQGEKHDAIAIRQVQDSQGRNITTNPTTKHVGDAGPLWIINDVLKGYNKRWNLGFDPAYHIAAKSGTSNRGTSTADGWMMAYNPHLVIAAWGGHTTNDPTKQDPSTKGFYGVFTGQEITAPFLRNAFKEADWKVDFTRPSGITQVNCPGAPAPSPGDSPNPDSAPKNQYAPPGGDYILAGDSAATCPTPPASSPSPTPSPSPNASPSPSPIDIVPTPFTTAGSSPSPSPRPSPTPRPSPAPSPIPSPNPSP
jgi:membrane peptidoglycan carboxypeptidase